MGLWDALSGRIHQWNTAKTEAARRTRAGLRSFKQIADKQYPGASGTILKVRNWFLAYYISAETLLSKELEGVFKPFKEQLFGLSADGHRNLIATMHISHAIVMNHEAKPLLELILQGIGIVYARPDSYLQLWGERVKWFTEAPDHVQMRIINRRYEEIATQLGLPSFDLELPFFWQSIQQRIVESSTKMFSHPDWPAMAEEAVQAP